MTTKQKVGLVGGLLIIIAAVSVIYNSWVNFQNQVSQINGHFVIPKAIAQTDNNVTAACQQEKDAMLDPALPTDAYNNELSFYNDNCKNITGELPQK